MYAAAKCLVISLIHDEFWFDQMSTSASSKQLFNARNRMWSSKSPPPLIAYPIRELPDVFCDFFISQVSNILADIQTHTCSTLWNVVRRFLSIQQVSESELKEVILLLSLTTCILIPLLKLSWCPNPNCCPDCQRQFCLVASSLQTSNLKHERKKHL